MEWIKVEDDFPDKTGKVIVCVDFYGHKQVKVCLYHILEGFLNDVYQPEENITHWMPLPEPPKD